MGKRWSLHLSIVTIKKAISCWAEVSWACDPYILEAEAVRGRLALAREQNLSLTETKQIPQDFAIFTQRFPCGKPTSNEEREIPTALRWDQCLGKLNWHYSRLASSTLEQEGRKLLAIALLPCLPSRSHAPSHDWTTSRNQEP